MVDIKRARDLTNAATPTAGDRVLIDGATTRSITVENFAAYVVASGSLGNWSMPQGRISLNTNTPFMTTSYAAQTTVYYAPALGNYVPIYNGTTIVPTVFTQRSQATTDATKSPAAVTTNSLYDIFVWSDAGTIRATRGPPWTSTTARGTGAGTTELVQVSGLFLNAIAITNGPAAQRGTYVGTIRTNASSSVDFILGGAASGGVAGLLGVWNMYNRTLINAASIDSGASYPYTSGSAQQARGASGTGNQISFVSGLASEAVSATYFGAVETAAAAGANGTAIFGLSLDSATALNIAYRFVWPPTAAISKEFTTVAGIVSPQLGYHTIYATEAGNGVNASTFNGSSVNKINVAFWC